MKESLKWTWHLVNPVFLTSAHFHSCKNDRFLLHEGSGASRCLCFQENRLKETQYTHLPEKLYNPNNQTVTLKLLLPILCVICTRYSVKGLWVWPLRIRLHACLIAQKVKLNMAHTHKRMDNIFIYLWKEKKKKNTWSAAFPQYPDFTADFSVAVWWQVINRVIWTTVSIVFSYTKIWNKGQKLTGVF